MPKTKEFIAYPLTPFGTAEAIRPTERVRQWQKDTPVSFAIRCLPLNIANGNGWELVCLGGFDAIYHGGSGIEAISIYPHGDGPVNAASHFGQGVLTFIVPFMFRTPEGINMTIQGPVNILRDGIQALTGIIETDWSPYTTTMNWKFTRPTRITFKKGEAYAQISPIPAAYVNGFEPRFGNIAKEEPQAFADYCDWSHKRVAFNHGLSEKDPDVLKQKWQKLYFTGKYPDGVRQFEKHKTKLSPKQFKGDPSNYPDHRGGGTGQGCPMHEQNDQKQDVTALIKVKRLDWRTLRLIDELVPRLKQIIIFYEASQPHIEDIEHKIHYKTIEFLRVTEEVNIIDSLETMIKYDILLPIEPEYLLLEDFWQKIDDYKRLLLEKYDEIRLNTYRSSQEFALRRHLESAVSCPNSILSPLYRNQRILCKKQSLFKGAERPFTGKDKLIIV